MTFWSASRPLPQVSGSEVRGDSQNTYAPPELSEPAITKIRFGYMARLGLESKKWHGSMDEVLEMFSMRPAKRGLGLGRHLSVAMLPHTHSKSGSDAIDDANLGSKASHLSPGYQN